MGQITYPETYLFEKDTHFAKHLAPVCVVEEDEILSPSSNSRRRIHSRDVYVQR
jgi:hypothetical protein